MSAVDTAAVEAMAALAGLTIEPHRLEAVREALEGMLATLAALDDLPLGDEPPEVSP
jgi:hypothetical protein